ncbi:hypothetical protein KUCAC02_027575, partial [Chaenocephalus aceratus]
SWQCSSVGSYSQNPRVPRGTHLAPFSCALVCRALVASSTLSAYGEASFGSFSARHPEAAVAPASLPTSVFV